MEQNQQPQPPVFNQPQQPAAPQYQPYVTPRPMMDPVTAVKTCFKKYFDFTGRARRSEFWWFMFFALIVSSIFNYGGLFVPALSYVGMLCSLVFFIPEYAVMTRRLHDTGRSGWWVVAIAVLNVVGLGAMAVMFAPVASELFEVTDSFAQAEMMSQVLYDSPIALTVLVCAALATLVLGIIIFVFTVTDSKWGENKYGPSPKYQ